MDITQGNSHRAVGNDQQININTNRGILQVVGNRQSIIVARNEGQIQVTGNGGHLKVAHNVGYINYTGNNGHVVIGGEPHNTGQVVYVGNNGSVVRKKVTITSTDTHKEPTPHIVQKTVIQCKGHFPIPKEMRTFVNESSYRSRGECNKQTMYTSPGISITHGRKKIQLVQFPKLEDWCFNMASTIVIPV